MPAKISAEIAGMKETQRRMEQIVKDLRGTPMINAMRDATLLVIRDAKINAPVDTGRLRASITPEVSADAEEVRGVVGSNVTYAPFVELGTKPHWVPISALSTWVHHKNLAGTYSVKTHRRTGSKASQESQDRSVAFVISRKIHISGTPAVEYLGKAFEANRQKIEARFNRAVTEIANKE